MGRNGRDGFTLLELLVVLTISVLTIGIAAASFGGYFQRSSARRAAQVFAQDLTQARQFAVRVREPVVIRFYESSLWYEIETQSGSTEVARRRFSSDGDIELTGATLDLVGDSVVFDRRGIADLSGILGTLGTATFTSGNYTYRVSFNSMGASKIEET